MVAALPARPSPTWASTMPTPYADPGLAALLAPLLQPELVAQPPLAFEPGGPAPPPPFHMRISMSYHCPGVTGMALVTVGWNQSVPLLVSCTPLTTTGKLSSTCSAMVRKLPLARIWPV